MRKHVAAPRASILALVAAGAAVGGGGIGCHQFDGRPRLLQDRSDVPSLTSREANRRSVIQCGPDPPKTLGCLRQIPLHRRDTPFLHPFGDGTRESDKHGIPLLAD